MSSGIANGAVSTIPPNNPVYASAATTGVGTDTVIYTVPTGRTFYCTGLLVSCEAAGGVIVKVNGVSIIDTDFAGLEKQALNGNPIFAATSGQTITIRGGANDFFGTVWGYYL